MFLIDREGYVVSWNRGAERLKGYAADEIIGKHFSVFYPPEAIERRWPQQELKLAAEAGRLEDEGWRLRKDGSRFWADVIITALHDETGELRGFSKVTRDLTERRAAGGSVAPERGALSPARRERQGLRDLHARSRGPRRRRWNAGAERINGYKAHEIIGRHFWRRSIRRTRSRRSGRSRSLRMAREHGRFEDEGWRVRKDGATFWASVVVTPIYDERRASHRLRQGDARPDRSQARRDAGEGRATDATSSSRCWPTSCAIRSRRSATRCSCSTRVPRPTRPSNGCAKCSSARRLSSPAWSRIFST